MQFADSTSPEDATTLGLTTLGITTLGLTTLGLTTLGLTTLGLMTLGLTTLGLTTFGIMTLVYNVLKGLFTRPISEHHFAISRFIFEYKNIQLIL